MCFSHNVSRNALMSLQDTGHLDGHGHASFHTSSLSHSETSSLGIIFFYFGNTQET